MIIEMGAERRMLQLNRFKVRVLVSETVKSERTSSDNAKLKI